MLCIVDGGLDILNKSVLARGVWGVQQGSRSLLFYLSLIWGGICHLPPLNPILKVKSLPPSSIFPDSPCRSDNSSPLKQGRDGGRGKGGGAEPPLQQHPSNCSFYTQIHPYDKRQSRAIPGPLQGHYSTPLSASAAGLVLLTASIWLFLQRIFICRLNPLIVGWFLNPGVM